jgi:hypothetical protein
MDKYISKYKNKLKRLINEFFFIILKVSMKIDNMTYRIKINKFRLK